MVVVVVVAERKLRQQYAQALTERGLEVLAVGSALVAEAAILRATIVGVLADLASVDEWQRVFKAANIRGVPTVAVAGAGAGGAQARLFGARMVFDEPVSPDGAADAVAALASGNAAVLAAAANEY